MTRGTARSRLRLWSWVLLLSGASSIFAEDLILRTPQPYTAMKQKIAALGGTVRYEFRNANALAVTVPDSKVAALKSLSGIDSVTKDAIVSPPKPREVRKLTEGLQALGATTMPNNYYPYTSTLTNAAPLQNAGILGQGVVVGIIDSGVSITADAIFGRVVGGENFVPGAGEPDATSPDNGDHGTFVACMIGANAAFGFSHNGGLATAVRTYCTPASTSPCSFDAGGGIDGIPMVGQAPFAQFYALKVFPAAGGGAPESRVLQAMDRAIELKKTTQPNMKVVNMSLGGTTLYAGKDVEDELASSMAKVGITLVTSSGNAGPSGSTVGSPGTARNILTVGAASDPVHEWIFNDAFFGPGIGPLFRPDGRQQVAYFSSRGPNADGRPDPELVANGVGCFVEGANGGIFLADGTSFAAPTVAGVAALLYSAKPSATPAKVRAAILRSARPNLIPAARREDQGAGYVDAAGAKALLDKGVLPTLDFGPGTPSVALNVLIGAGVIPVIGSHISKQVSNLLPSERREFYFQVAPDTSQVHVTLSDITPSLPPDQQNVFFGDDVQFAVHTAKTSAIDGEGDYLAFGYFNSDETFTFDRPDTGLMRVTVVGDWTNVGNVSARVTIEEEKAHLSKRDFKGTIAEGELKTHSFQVAPGTSSVTFALSWENNWGAYPTDDLDLFIQAPDGTFYFDGATIASPERTTIANPAAGTWTIYVDGFTVFEHGEKYAVRVD